MKRFDVALMVTAVIASAGWLGWNAARDRHLVAAAWASDAVRIADALRQARLRGDSAEAWRRTAARDYDVVVHGLPATGVDVVVVDALRIQDSPIVSLGRVYAPLTDADGWDMVGVVEAAPRASAPRQANLWRGAVLLPLALFVAAVAWLLAWSRRADALRRRDTLVAWSFLGVPMAHLVVFSFAPVVFTLLLSVHQWDMVSSARPYVGLANYRELAGDPLFWKTLRNTAVYVLYVPVTLAIALGLALWLNRRRRGEKLLRAVVFMPYVTSTVAIALVWQWLMNADFGLVNFGLRLVGLPAVDWLGNPATALIAIIIVTVWTQVGYQMLVLLAGLQAVPQHYLDAAVVDGASPLRRFWHVTLPLMRPVLLFVLVTGVISGFQVFTLVYLMTEGGPLHATDVLVYRIYQTAWEFLRFGSASAMAVVLFAILLVVTIVQFRLLGRRIEHV